MIFFIRGSVFWPEKFKSDVYFYHPELETIDNPKNNFRIIDSFVIKFYEIQSLPFDYWSLF